MRGGHNAARGPRPSGPCARIDAAASHRLLEQDRVDTIRWFDELSLADVDEVGGKGANLGELTRAGSPSRVASW